MHTKASRSEAKGMPGMQDSSKFLVQPFVLGFVSQSFGLKGLNLGILRIPLAIEIFPRIYHKQPFLH